MRDHWPNAGRICTRCRQPIGQGEKSERFFSKGHRLLTRHLPEVGCKRQRALRYDDFMVGARVRLRAGMLHTHQGRVYTQEVRQGQPGVITREGRYTSEHLPTWSVRWDHNDYGTSAVDQSCIEVIGYDDAARVAAERAERRAERRRQAERMRQEVEMQRQAWERISQTAGNITWTAMDTTNYTIQTTAGRIQFPRADQ